MSRVKELLAGLSLAAEMFNTRMHMDAVRSSNGNPVFIPRKHTVMSYAKQNRIAKKRRNNKQKSK